jgi:hypothetical protein
VCGSGGKGLNQPSVMRAPPNTLLASSVSSVVPQRASTQECTDRRHKLPSPDPIVSHGTHACRPHLQQDPCGHRSAGLHSSSDEHQHWCASYLYSHPQVCAASRLLETYMWVVGRLSSRRIGGWAGGCPVALLRGSDRRPPQKPAAYVQLHENDNHKHTGRAEGLGRAEKVKLPGTSHETPSRGGDPRCSP